jgi:glyoxylase-like metal-dependent hydrolase (beta-lactamase superfamily II)
LELGEFLWQVHAAPGHDPHAVILFEPESRTLISADALWQNGFGVVFPELEGLEAFSDVGATLDLIEKLSPKVVVPGHGAVFIDVSDALGRARSRLDTYLAQPRKHAAHAVKVLMKFKLLELQTVLLTDFMEWADRTPYFAIVWQQWFNEQAVKPWLASIWTIWSVAARRASMEHTSAMLELPRQPRRESPEQKQKARHFCRAFVAITA